MPGEKRLAMAHEELNVRVALYHPWVYLKSGLERTLLEVVRRSRHDWTVYTSHYDREGTYPELKDVPVVELSRVSVRRNYGAAIAGAMRLANTRIDLSHFDALVISCDGLGDLLTLRNTSRPVLCLCFTPLRAAYDPSYRERLLARTGALSPLAMVAELGFRAIDRFCWRRYDGVVAISETVRQRIIAGGLYPPEAIEILYPGIDGDRIRPSLYAEPYFLVAGRIMWTKNIQLAMEAFALARPRLPPGFQLKIAGMVDAKSQSYFEGLRRRAAEIGGIEFALGPSDSEMRTLYDRCSAGMFTAFNEDWGLVPLEFMAAGKPVIAVDAGGPRESVLDGVTGFLEPDDPASFSRRLVQLGNRPDLARTLGSAGAERARGFSWQAFVAGLDDHLDRLVGTADRRKRR
jgi:glycosyltransferase involved in cell wall biosynthesis